MSNRKTIPIYEPYFTQKEINYVTDCVKSGWISSAGPYIERFSSACRDFFKVKYAYPVCSGTAAMHLALLALNIKTGDEVIVPSFTYIATVNPVRYVGATPVFVDVNLHTYALEPKLVEKNISKKTKAIIAAHLYGTPADLHELSALCRKHGLYLIEDAAESFGSEYKNKKVGTFGDVGCLSFYGNKTVTTGDGGMLITNNKKVFEKAVYFASNTMNSKHIYWHNEIGYNYKMSSLQAAFGLGQLENIKSIVRKKQYINDYYTKHLSKISDIKINKPLRYVKIILWLFTFFCKSKIQRDKLYEYLSVNNIESRKTFNSIPKMLPYKSPNIYKISEELADTGISLPSSPVLNQNDLNYITHKIQVYFNK